jgi:DNA-binding HxlR family transcriptional regulator
MPKYRHQEAAPDCSMETVMNLIGGGSWKGVILYRLLEGTLRFNILKAHMPGCSPRILMKELRELEDEGLVKRDVFAAMPPRVDYSLTEEGRSIGPLLLGLYDWGTGWLERRGIPTCVDLSRKQ